MKSLFPLLVAFSLLFFFITCSSTTDSSDQASSIVGKWNWIKSDGWPGSNTPEKAGYTKQIVFRINSTYLEYRDDILFLKSEYRIDKKDINDDNVDESILIIDELLEEYIVDSFQNDTLLLRIINCADCQDKEYYTKTK